MTLALICRVDGSVSSRRIIDYRTANGPLRSLEDVRKAGVTAANAQRAAEFLTYK